MRRLSSSASRGLRPDRLQVQVTWQETPEPFGGAQLELGDDLLVELPEPSWESKSTEIGIIDVRGRGAAEGLRLHADLLAMRSHLEKAKARLERVEKELARAREDLEEAGRVRAQLTCIRRILDDGTGDGGDVGRVPPPP